MDGRPLLGACLILAGCLPADELQNYSDGSVAPEPAPVSTTVSPATPSDPVDSTLPPLAAAEVPGPPASDETDETSEAETPPEPLLDPEPVEPPGAVGASPSEMSEVDEVDETTPPVDEESPATSEPEPPAPAAPSRFRFVRLVADSAVQSPYTAVAEFNLLDGAGVAIDRAGWVASADSEEDVFVGGAGARFAIDGDPITMWHTAWFAVSPAPAHPHTLEIDMGSLHEVGGFRYLGRQDGSLDGRIAAFRFFVSVDGEDWGQPVVQGTLDNSDQEQEIRLP